jgi:hypothetical protein
MYQSGGSIHKQGNPTGAFAVDEEPAYYSEINTGRAKTNEDIYGHKSKPANENNVYDQWGGGAGGNPPPPPPPPPGGGASGAGENTYYDAEPVPQSGDNTYYNADPVPLYGAGDAWYSVPNGEDDDAATYAAPPAGWAGASAGAIGGKGNGGKGKGSSRAAAAAAVAAAADGGGVVDDGYLDMNGQDEQVGVNGLPLREGEDGYQFAKRNSLC